MKSCEISIKVVKAKAAIGEIVEKGWGFSSWIIFGERGLAWLLEGVEALP